MGVQHWQFGVRGLPGAVQHQAPLLEEARLWCLRVKLHLQRHMELTYLLDGTTSTPSYIYIYIAHAQASAQAHAYAPSPSQAGTVTPRAISVTCHVSDWCGRWYQITHTWRMLVYTKRSPRRCLAGLTKPAGDSSVWRVTRAKVTETASAWQPATRKACKDFSERLEKLNS